MGAPISLQHVTSAMHALTHPAVAEQEIEATVKQAGNAARRQIRRAAPRAKGLPPNSRYASGNARKRGDLARAVSIKAEGAGFTSLRRIHAGGVASIIVPGRKAHDIAPKHAQALLVPANFTMSASPRKFAGSVPLAHVHVAAVPANPFVERGAAAAKPEIDVLMAQAGQRIVMKLAAEIERGA